ncbi:hypothetical protein APA_3199 [Pseudanabaena sp. lw0831]|nr:hypothetical protein APA_3199 [Pseudanabaena sp. lw0831]
MKSILGFASGTALQTLKSVLRKISRRLTFLKTDFQNENSFLR